MGEATTDVRCRDCGASTEVALHEGESNDEAVHPFDLHCDACGAEWEGRYRAESGTIVWQ